MSVHVASAVAAQQEYVQELFDAFKQCCQVWVFFLRSEEFRSSSGEFSSSLGNFSSCVQYPKFNYLIGILEHHAWQLWWYDHLVPSGCPALRASPVVAGFAIF